MMESIEKFRIEVDIGSCTKLYDYGNSEFIKRPASGKWSKQLLLERPPQMVTASNGYSLIDTKQKVARLDSVLHHLAEHEIPWTADGDSSSGSGCESDQGVGFAVPYVEDNLINLQTVESADLHGKNNSRDTQGVASNNKKENSRDDLNQYEQNKTSISLNNESRNSNNADERNTQEPMQVELNLTDGGVNLVDLPPRLLPLYYPGDTVKGSLHIVIKHDIPASQVLCKLEGSVKTKIRQRDTIGTHHSFKRGKIDHVSQTRCLWMDRHGTLARGEHRLQFEFLLPTDCPGSTPDLLPPNEREYAYVGYRIKAVISNGTNSNNIGYTTTQSHAELHRDSDRRLEDVVVHRGLWVEKSLRVVDVESNFTKPYVKSVVMDTGVISKGKVSCSVKLATRTFIRGDQMPVILDIDNEDKLDILAIKCRVKLKGKARSCIGQKQLEKNFVLKGCKVKESGLPAGHKAVKNLSVCLSVKNLDQSLLPVSSCDFTGLLEVKYFLQIVLKRQGVHRNITFEIPIKVASHA